MTAIVAFLWQYKQIIADVIGVIVIAILAWWFFWHNPKVIDSLEKDKAELSRQVENSKNAIVLLDDIQKGKVKINEAVQTQISSVKSQAVPRRAVLIRGGSVLPRSTVYKTNTAAGASTGTAGGGK